MIQNFSRSTVQGLLCHTFRFMMCQMFSKDDESGLQAGQFNTQTLLYVARLSYYTQNVVQGCMDAVSVVPLLRCPPRFVNFLSERGDTVSDLIHQTSEQFSTSLQSALNWLWTGGA